MRYYILLTILLLLIVCPSALGQTTFNPLINFKSLEQPTVLFDGDSLSGRPEFVDFVSIIGTDYYEDKKGSDKCDDSKISCETRWTLHNWRKQRRQIDVLHRSERRAERKSADSNIDSLQTLQDSRWEEFDKLWHDKMFNLMREIKISPFLFPTRNAKLSSYYYKGTLDQSVETLRNNYFNVGTSQSAASIYTEAIGGYLWFMRISLGLMVAKSELQSISGSDIDRITGDALDSAGFANAVEELDALRQETDSINAARLNVQSFFSGGGNTVLTVSTPVLIYANPRSRFNYNSVVYYRLGFLLPEIGVVSNDPQFTNEFAFEQHFDLDLSIQEGSQFSFILRNKLSHFRSKEFIEDLNDDLDKDAFWFVEIAPGFELNRTVRISANIPIILTKGLDALNNKVTIGANIMPFR